jgi:hypothetical protein
LVRLTVQKPMTKLSLQDAAHTIVCVPLAARYRDREAMADQFEGVFTMYYVCPPSVAIERLDIPDSQSQGEIGGIAHRDASCVVVSVDHF